MVREAGARQCRSDASGIRGPEVRREWPAQPSSIIPSDIQGIAGLAASIKEIVTDDPNAPKQSETPNA